jgi:transcriptional regulator with XRE-family HTH domain
MTGDHQRKLLGDFVRAHRERLTPDPPLGRRRTPGLRREELAARAQLSATWVTWIEQGRDAQASPQALARLAEALLLTRAERAYLFELAGRRDPAHPPVESSERAPDSLAAAVEALPHPAYGLDRFWNAIAWNAAAADLLSGWLGEGRDHNLLRYIFLDPSARRVILDWPDRAARALAEFRADFGASFNDPPMLALVEQLIAESADFAALWKAQTVMDREGGDRGFLHPTRGLLRFRQFTFRPADRPDCKLVMLSCEQ